MFVGDLVDCCSFRMYVRLLDTDNRIVYEGLASHCYKELRSYYVNVITTINDGFTQKLLIHVSHYI